MKKKINIVKMGINGEGIGYINKKPIFVSNCFPDEVVECEIPSLKDVKFLKTTASKIVVESKYRLKNGIENKKDVSCPLLDLEYKRQLFYKKEIVKESISKYCKLDVSIIDDVVENDKIYNYRNQCKLPVKEIKGKLYSGLFEPYSNNFIKLDDCIIHDKNIEFVRKKVIDILNKYNIKGYDNKNKKGIRHIVVRCLYEKCQICLVGGNDVYSKNIIDEILNIESVVSLWQNINCKKNSVDIFGDKDIFLGGLRRLEFEFLNFKINLLPKSFFQLNTLQTEKLYKLVCSFIKDCDFIVEAYCGIGIMSLMASDKANKVIGIESNKDAINNAMLNALNNNLSNKCEFICDDSTRALSKIKNKINYLLLDPPRSGLLDEMINCIMKKDIDNIIYVSCNPATLSKNLNVLKSKYKIKKIIPLDIFSHTANIECITYMEKRVK